MKKLMLAIICAMLLCGAGFAIADDAKPTGSQPACDGKPTGSSVASAPLAETVLEKGFKKIFPDYDNQPLAEALYADDKADATLAEKCEYVAGKGCKVYPVRKQKALLGFAMLWQGKGYKGTIQLMLGFTAAGDIVGMDVITNGDTPKLGGKIANAEFQQRFLKKNLKNTKWAIEKDSGDIRAVSGASFSSRAAVTIVKETLELYDKRQVDLKKAAGVK